MASELFDRFLVKMCEVEKMYQTFKKEDQEISLKVLVSLCKRFEMVLGPSYSMTTYMLYTTQGIEDYFSQMTSNAMQNTQGVMDGLMTLSAAVDYSQKIQSDWTNTKPREPQPPKRPAQNTKKTVQKKALPPKPPVVEDYHDDDDADDKESGQREAKEEKPDPAPKQEPPPKTGSKKYVRKRKIPARTRFVPKRKTKSRAEIEAEVIKSLPVKKKRRRRKYPLSNSCETCPETFDDHQVYLRHCLEAHRHSMRSCRWCQVEFTTDIPADHDCRKKVAAKGRMCPKCGEEHPTTTLLRRHIKHEHGKKAKKNASYYCRFCGKGFMKQQSMFAHFKEHAGGQYVCMRCGLFSPDLETYRNHKHIQIEQRANPCPICSKVFARPDILINHLKSHPGEQPLECSNCRLFFRNEKSLARHKKSHCPAGERAAKEKKFSCQECGKALLSKHALERHMRYHTGEKPHVCSYCGFKFREINNLKRHMNLHFDGHRSFKCEMCGAAFHAKKTLEMHHAYKHSEERKYKCPQCPKAFKAKNALGRHSKVHTTEKNHKCWCGSAFKLMYKLRQHLRSVHGTDEMLPPVRRVSNLDTSNTSKSKKDETVTTMDRPDNVATPTVTDTLVHDAMAVSGMMVQPPLPPGPVASPVKQLLPLPPQQPPSIMHGGQQHRPVPTMTNTLPPLSHAIDNGRHLTTLTSPTQNPQQLMQYNTPVPGPHSLQSPFPPTIPMTQCSWPSNNCQPVYRTQPNNHH